MMRCVNPGSKHCDCGACLTDRGAISSARNRAIYNGYKNSIVEWMLSEEWTVEPSLIKVRGMTEIDGMHTQCASGEASGEIPWRKFDGLSRKMVAACNFCTIPNERQTWHAVVAGC